MLASNILNKSPENFKLKAKKIYSKIQIFMKYHNESFENRTDISSLKGKFKSSKNVIHTYNMAILLD